MVQIRIRDQWRDGREFSGEAHVVGIDIDGDERSGQESPCVYRPRLGQCHQRSALVIHEVREVGLACLDRGDLCVGHSS